MCVKLHEDALKMRSMCVRWIPVHVYFLFRRGRGQRTEWAVLEEPFNGGGGLGIPQQGRNGRRTIRGKRGGKAKRRTRKNRRMGLKRRSNQSIVSFFVVFLLFFQEFASCPTVQKFFFPCLNPPPTQVIFSFSIFFFLFLLLLLLFVFPFAIISV